jgi:hypothetical protein
MPHQNFKEANEAPAARAATAIVVFAFRLFLPKATAAFKPGATLAPSRPCGTANCLLLKAADVSNERLNLIVRKTFGWLHLDFLAVLNSFLDRLEHFVVLQTGLVLRVGLVLDSSRLPGFGLAFAVLAVAGGTLLVPVGLDVGGPRGNCDERENQRCNEEKYIFHGVKVSWVLPGDELRGKAIVRKVPHRKVDGSRGQFIQSSTEHFLRIECHT